MGIAGYTWKRVGLCCLVLCLLFSSGMSTVLAETNDFHATMSDEVTTDNSSQIQEIESMRELHSKTYRLEDGTYRYVGYAEDIHFVNSEGKLQDINNEVTEVTDKTGYMYCNTAKTGYMYCNTANSWRAFFAENLRVSEAVLLTKDECQISFSMPTASISGGVAKSDSLSTADADYYKDLAKDNRAVLYEDVLPDIDIAYTVKTNVLKEDIILKSASAPTTFTFDLRVKGLSLAEKDGDVFLCDGKGNTVFEFAPMYMVDANGKRSDAVSYHMEAMENGYKIYIIADIGFLKAVDTVYPVIVDPSVMVTGSSSTYDTCVDQQFPTSNYYLSENLWTGGALGTNAMRTYIKFNLPSVISPAKVTYAYIRIKKKEYQTPYVKAYRVVGSWTSSNLTWNNKPDYTSINASRTAEPDTVGWYKLDATPFVRQCMKGAYNNYGVVIKEPTEWNSSQKTKFYSSDAPSPNKPELIIEYLSSLPNARLVGVVNSGHDHLSWLIPTRDYLEDCDFSSADINLGAFAVSTIHSYLDTDSSAMFISRSHGWVEFDNYGNQTATALVLNDDPNNYVMYRSYSMNTAGLNLTNMQLILFVACSTGLGGEGGNNLPTVAVSRGAQTAVGFSSIVSCNAANTWTELFAECMEDGFTVEDACVFLAEDPYFTGTGLKSFVICGDRSTMLTGRV